MVGEGFVAGERGAFGARLGLRAFGGLRHCLRIGLGLLLRRP